MEKPKVIFKEPAVGYLFGGLLLLTAFLFGMVNCFSPSETQPGEVPHFVMLAFFVVSAVFFIFLGRTYTVVDENGILWGSDFGKKQYSWSDVKKVGIECRRFRSQKHGTIVLNISGKKEHFPIQNAVCSASMPITVHRTMIFGIRNRKNFKGGVIMKNQKMLIVVIVVIACFLTACNFTTNFSDGLGVTKMEAYSQVEEMMTAFSNNDKQAGLALMHPDYVSKFEAAYEQLVVFLNGRKVSKMTQNSVNVKTSSGTGGSVRQETGSLLVTLEDGTEFYLSVCHVRESGKEGFISFQFVLGVI